jgi:hypothetical protein
MSDTDTDNDSVVLYGSEYDIYDDDGEYMETEVKHGSYYIGLAGYVKGQIEPILMSTISPRAFMLHDHSIILEYLTAYSISKVDNPTLDILHVHIDDRQTYNVTIKTHWLRLFQRRWKNIYAKRINMRKKPSSLLYRAVHGKFPTGKFPTDLFS